MKCGGGSRTRTGDIRLAKPTLYQLSYAPSRSDSPAPGLASARACLRTRGAGGGVRQRFVSHEEFGPCFLFFGRRGGQALRAMCRRVGVPSAEADSAKPDELTIGTLVAKRPSP